MGNTKLDITENQLDYSIPIFTGTHNKKTSKIKKPVLLRFADDESGLTRDEDDYITEKEKSSTERVRRYYKRHPEKVRKYLKSTVKDRVARNRDRKKAVEKYGEDKMKNHDVHHPGATQSGKWRLAKKDHGPDKKDGTPKPTPKTTPKKKKSVAKPTSTKKPVQKKSTPKKAEPKKSTPSSTAPKKKTVPKDLQRVVSRIKKFVDYASSKLKLKNPPTITVIKPTSDITSLGYYEPATNKIAVVVKGRLMADILRTLAHEMVHQKQRELNLPMDGTTGSDTENQANATAGILMRNYGQDNTDIFLSEATIPTDETKSRFTVYQSVRNLTDDEIANEVGEYFENEKTFKTFPTLAKNKEELTTMIQNAPDAVLTDAELQNLINSEVPAVMKSKKPREIIKQLAQDDKASVVKILKGIKAEDELPFPIVIKFPNGNYLLGGNRRLSILAATGQTMPVKVLDYGKEPILEPSDTAPIGTPSPEPEKKAPNSKELFNRIMQMKINNPETGNMIKIDTAMDYKKTHPAHIFALNTIRQYMKGISSRAGVAKNKKLS
jgi:hypothetical protein